MTLIPPFGAGEKDIMKRWLEREAQSANGDGWFCRDQLLDGDPLLQIAAWLDGRLNERDSARVELLLASDPHWLQATLALRQLSPEPVPTVELQRGQALVSASTARSSSAMRPARTLQWLTTLWSAWQNWQPVPLAAGAMLSALIVTGGVWLGSAASQDFSLDDLQSTSQFEITQLDFSGSNGVAVSAE
jgi:hypothetical protein